MGKETTRETELTDGNNVCFMDHNARAHLMNIIYIFS